MRTTLIAGAVAMMSIGSLALAVVRAQGSNDARVQSSSDTRGQDNSDETESRRKIGLAYAKEQGIQLDLRGKNRGRVALGSYLVNAVGGCNDCHTAPPYIQDPFAFLGAPKQINAPCYLAGGMAFGPIVSRDITPFEDGKPAGLTFEEFRHVIRTGEDPDNPGKVLQVMPWPVYQSLTDGDLLAIYEYLTAIPAINANVCGEPSE